MNRLLVLETPRMKEIYPFIPKISTSPAEGKSPINAQKAREQIRLEKRQDKHKKAATDE